MSTTEADVKLAPAQFSFSVTTTGAEGWARAVRLTETAVLAATSTEDFEMTMTPEGVVEAV